jgi:hypothetical protein
MDHAPGMSPAAAPVPGPLGRPRRERVAARARRPAETPGYPGGNATARQGNARYLPGGNARSPGGGNARHPGRKCAVSRRETCRLAGVNAADHRPPDDNAAGQRPLGGKRRWLAKPAAERTPGGGPGKRVWIAPSFRADETVRGAGPDGPHRGPGGGPAGPTARPISKSQVLRSQIPARSIGNDNYPFTYGPVTRTRSAVAAEWPAYSFSASAMAAAPSWGHSSSQLQPIVLHLRRSEDWRHECPRSGSNRHWGPF